MRGLESGVAAILYMCLRWQRRSRNCARQLSPFRHSSQAMNRGKHADLLPPKRKSSPQKAWRGVSLQDSQSSLTLVPPLIHGPVLLKFGTSTDSFTNLFSQINDERG